MARVGPVTDVFLYKLWQDESRRSNRCAYFRRSRGCKKGATCRYRHQHPIEEEERKGKPNRGFKEKEAEDEKKERREGTAEIAIQIWLAKKDMLRILRFGKALWFGNSSCAISIMTTLRSTERAEATAKDVAAKLGIGEKDICIRLNLDCKSPNHFEPTDFVKGYQAYYLAVAYRVLPALIDLEGERADIHFLLEDDCVLNVIGAEVLAKLVQKFKDAPLAFLGHFGVGGAKKRWPYVAPPQ